MAELYDLDRAIHSTGGAWQGMSAFILPVPPRLGSGRMESLLNDWSRTVVGGYPALVSVPYDVFGIPRFDYGTEISVGWPYPVSVTEVTFDWTTWQTGSGGNARFGGATLFFKDGTSEELKSPEVRNNTTLKTETFSGTWANVYALGLSLNVSIPDSGTNAGNLVDLSITGTFDASGVEIQFYEGGKVYRVLVFESDVANEFVTTSTNVYQLGMVGSNGVILGGTGDSSLSRAYRLRVQKEVSAGVYVNQTIPGTTVYELVAP